MVAHLHDAGLEAILDVVYNHTAEGNERGPSLSFRGIDNASYYRLLPDQQRFYINDTGTGNTLNLSHSRVLQMVTDSLRYWVQEMHVDGFRFDLGTILAREPHGFDESSGFLHACRQDPVLNSVKLIAEPWDCGPGGYQVGGFPPGWAEWNDKFRDDVRRFWKGDEGMAPAMAARMSASADLFNKRGRKPWSTVNFITAHDRFTLRDVVSYNEKHNEANGEDGRDGSDSNSSWNHGVEGETNDAEINERRRRHMRNMLATLLLSQGTPMILAGDEFGRTQNGNNNAYCQDNEISWFDWDLSEWAKSQVHLVQRLTKLRHDYPILRRGRFFTGTPIDALDVKDVTWINASGAEMEDGDWGDPSMKCFGMLIDGRAQATGIRKPGSDTTLLIVLNAHHDLVTITLPNCTNGKTWDLILDTNVPDRDDLQSFGIGDTYDVTSRSLLLFALVS
jgi:glycogen operon protein